MNFFHFREYAFPGISGTPVDRFVAISGILTTKKERCGQVYGPVLELSRELFTDLFLTDLAPEAGALSVAGRAHFGVSPGDFRHSTSHLLNMSLGSSI
jgi:hypothetical protein